MTHTVEVGPRNGGLEPIWTGPCRQEAEKIARAWKRGREVKELRTATIARVITWAEGERTETEIP